MFQEELRQPLEKIRITQEFGKEFVYFDAKTSTYYEFYNSYGLKGHPGIDYACEIGTPVYACHDGVIMYASYDNVNGNMVQVWNKEKGFKTLYGHNSVLKVKTGDIVRAGDLIALSGDTGAGTGPHLHLGGRLTAEGGNSLDIDNGYNGAFDILPFITLTYDGKKIISMETAKFIKQNDLKWIRNQKTGSFGRILQGELKTFQTTDRACLALLDDKVRKEGLNISDEIWSNLPKNAF